MKTNKTKNNIESYILKTYILYLKSEKSAVKSNEYYPESIYKEALEHMNKLESLMQKYNVKAITVEGKRYSVC